jgi:hypothetical protein
MGAKTHVGEGVRCRPKSATIKRKSNVMPPNQHNQPTPSSNGQQPSYTPQPPHYDYNTAPRSQQILQNPSGHYEVVPALSPNNAHPSGHNPYDFIVNPNTPKNRKSLFGRGGTPSWKGLALFGGILVVLAIIVVSVLSSMAPKGSTPGLTLAAQRQQEIIRVATLATIGATGQDTKNFVANVQLSITSSQVQTLNYLQAHGTKLKLKQLSLYKDTQTDTLLTNAANAGNYDKVVVQTLSTQLQTYQDTLQDTEKDTNSTSAKQLLKDDYANAQKLLAQASDINTVD